MTWRNCLDSHAAITGFNNAGPILDLDAVATPIYVEPRCASTCICTRCRISGKELDEKREGSCTVSARCQLTFDCGDTQKNEMLRG